MALTQQQRNQIVHQTIAADRLKRSGKSNDEINDSLRRTTHEQRVQANNAWLERQQAKDQPKDD